MALSRLVSDDPCRRVEQAAIQCECSPSDLNAFLIGTERFKTTLEDFKGIFLAVNRLPLRSVLRFSMRRHASSSEQVTR